MENRTNDELPPAVRNLAIDFLKLLTLLSGGGVLLMSTALLTYLSGEPKNSFILWLMVAGVNLFSITLWMLVSSIRRRIKVESRGIISSPKMQQTFLIKDCHFVYWMLGFSVLVMLLLVFSYSYNFATATKSPTYKELPLKPSKQKMSRLPLPQDPIKPW